MGQRNAFFTISSFSAFVAYLALSAGGNGAGIWPIEEILAGIAVSVLAGIAASDVMSGGKEYRVLNPIRWFTFLAYLTGPFFFAMVKANLDVAYRVITGNIDPGIFRLQTGLKTGLGITLLANSITLTPGTLSVDVDESNNDVYIHCINVRSRKLGAKNSCERNFIRWIRRITE